MIAHSPQRAEVWWVVVPGPLGKRPALVVQDDAYNNSRINSIVVVPCTTVMKWRSLPGNVALSYRRIGLPKPTVANVTNVTFAERGWFDERIGVAPDADMDSVDAGLKLLLSLY